MNGVLVIQKPQGLTSHDVVNQARRILQEKRIGHTGTLDPLATGVLVLCIGKATKIVRYLESDDKDYTAELRLGMTTDTQDADGRVLETREHEAPSFDRVLEVVQSFQGVILQRPPAYSALKVSGTPSHRLARKGSLPLHAERPVTIHQIIVLEYAYPFIRFSVRCSKGTYIRTLCADMGERLGMGAHLTALVRTRSGRFRLEEAISLDRLAEMILGGQAEAALLPLSDALGGFAAVSVDEADAGRIAHGMAIAVPRPFSGGGRASRVRILGQDGRLVAVATADEGMLRPEVVLLENIRNSA